MNKNVYEDLFLVVTPKELICSGVTIDLKEIEQIEIVDNTRYYFNSFLLPAMLTENLLLSSLYSVLVCALVFIILGLRNRYTLKVKGTTFNKNVYDSNSVAVLQNIKHLIEEAKS